MGQKEFNQNLKEPYRHVSHDKDLHDAFPCNSEEKHLGFWFSLMYLVKN